MPEIKVAINGQDNLSGVLSKLEGNILNFGKIIGVAFGTAKIIEFGKQAVKAYDDMLLASSRLTMQIGKSSDTLVAYALAQAKVTRNAKDEILAAMNVLAVHKLNQAQIMKLIPVIEDYAAKSGRPLVEAAQAFGFSVQYGTTRALRPYGIELEKNGSQLEIFNTLLKAGQGNVKGFSNQIATMGLGPLVVFRNQMNDMADDIGQKLMPAVLTFTTYLKDHQKEITDFGVALAEKVGAGLKIFVDVIVTHGKEIKDFFIIMGDVLLVTNLIKIAGGIQGVAIAIKSMSTATVLANAAMAANPVGLLVLGGAAAAAGTGKALSDYEKNLKQRDELNKKYGAGKYEVTKVGGAAAGAPMVLPITGMAPAITPASALETEISKLGVTPLGGKRKRAEIPFDMNDKAIMAQGLKAVEATRAINKMKLDSSFFLLKTEIDINNKRISNEERYIEVYRKLSNEQVNQVLTCSSIILSDIANISEAYGQDVIVRKRMMQGQALINTYFAATQAYAEGLKAGFPVGFVLAPAMAALAVASGIANVKRIEGTKFAFGGEVPGNPNSGDSVPALLTPGERIFTKRQQEKMTSTINYHIDNSTVVQGNIDPRAVQDFNRSRQRQTRDLVNAMRYAKMTGQNIGVFA